MAETADEHLARLAHADTCRVLTALGLPWPQFDRSIAGALRFKRHNTSAPLLLGIIGGASSGKSTLFNTLVERPASRISAHAHETTGALAAVHVDHLAQMQDWIDRDLLFGDLQAVTLQDTETTTGKLDAMTLVPHHRQSLRGVVLLDTPDVTSKMSVDEGALTRRLLPWFDALIIVVDEERWFDAAVFEPHTAWARDLAQQFFILFNRTMEGDALTPQDRHRLAEHAGEQHGSAHALSTFQPGAGYRPLGDDACTQVGEWIGRIHADRRDAGLEVWLQRRCAEVVNLNLDRSEQFSDMCRAVERELAARSEEIHLTTDLLTTEEQRLLGLSHRFVPLYETMRALRRHASRWFGAGSTGEVDFEKRTATLAQVLRRNLEQRFRHATDRIDQCILGSAYLRQGAGSWQPGWTCPPFDEQAWAHRVQRHIDAWKEEAAKHTRQSDVAAVLLGAPLLLADLVLLGGAGMTLTWTLASVAGFFLGKGAATLTQRSPAFRDYQTTVRAYQAFLQEALAEQWTHNLQALPRRHLRMSDPITQALLAWSRSA